jgi:phosphopantothenoylcysteine decarboxylase / phosphopantothenate---cysteine ligase
VANVVVGVTGGIAAYKSALLIRLFAEAGHSVQVVATTNSFRFIGKATLEALSKNQVAMVDPDLFTDVDQVKHIAIAKNADLIVVAPATASFLAKLAAGIADDLLTTTVLAATVPVVLAPAMHTEMWENAATSSNLQTLQERNFHIVPPGTGRLTGEDTGVGRLAEPEDIFESAISFLGPRPLLGKRVLITAGGTREPIDSARFIGNYSSGKQGVAFARAAKQMGAEVELIAANLDTQMVRGISTTHVNTARELALAVEDKLQWFDLVVMAAAVADYSPANPTQSKLKRAQLGTTFELSLQANPDILANLVASLGRSSRKVITVGFAAETSRDLEQLARTKLEAKGCDYLVANDITGGAVFGSDQTKVLLVSKDDLLEIEGSKTTVAQSVLSVLATKLGEL